MTARAAVAGTLTVVLLGTPAVATLAALPLVDRRDRPARRVAAAALGHAALGAGVWVGAFALAPFRIICRLF